MREKKSTAAMKRSQTSTNINLNSTDYDPELVSDMPKDTTKNDKNNQIKGQSESSKKVETKLHKSSIMAGNEAKWCVLRSY